MRLGRLRAIIQDMEDLRYPVGEFLPPSALDARERANHIEQIERTPERLRAAVSGLDARQLDTPYREGGWTARQVVHHLADSHMNGYIRFRLALTEDLPTIRLYMEERWAELADARTAPVELSVDLLGAVHGRWVLLLTALRDEDWARSVRHPELGIQSLAVTLAKYSWHGRHHVAHIESLRKRKGWS